MPRKANSFSRALSDATQRLEQAQRQRQSTREMLARLELEIPALQRTIAALRSQLNPSPEAKPDGSMAFALDYKMITTDGPKDLRGTEPTEEDLLPEPDGTPLTPED